MVAQALQIFADHKQIQRGGGVVGIFSDILCNFLADFGKHRVAFIIGGNDLRRFGQIHLHIRADGTLGHLQGGGTHLVQIVHHADGGGTFRLQMQGDLGNVAGVVRHTLNVGDHFQRRGHLAQVGGNGLLAQDQRQAAMLDLMLGGVDLIVLGNDAARQLGIVIAQGGHGAFDRCARGVTHPRQQGIQLQKLGIVGFASAVHIVPLLNRNARRCNPRCACLPGWRTGARYRPFLPARPAGKMPSYR